MENASKALIIAGAILIAILLISIGIILVNGGNDMSSAGTAQMNSQKIQSFNSPFLSYEGVKKGSELRGLRNAVEASNATDEEHQITLTGWTATLVATKDYTVTFTYTDGYVSEIEIAE